MGEKIHYKGGCRVGADYVFSMYPSPPHTIHPPHIGSTILGESVIVFQRLQIHFNNIVSLLVQSSPEFDCLLLRTAGPKIPLLTERL